MYLLYVVVYKIILLIFFSCDVSFCRVYLLLLFYNSIIIIRKAMQKTKTKRRNKTKRSWPTYTKTLTVLCGMYAHTTDSYYTLYTEYIYKVQKKQQQQLLFIITILEIYYKLFLCYFVVYNNNYYCS